MNYTFDTRIILLICCLLQGLAGLRMVKVSIPAYKLRGESAFLECQYELNRSHGALHVHGGHRQPHPGANEHHGNGMNYVDVDENGEIRPAYRRQRNRPQPRQQYQQHQPRRHHYPQAQLQPKAEALAYQTYDQQQLPHQHQHQHQHHQQQHPYPYQTQPSPYGHSVYRGSSSSSYLAPSSSTQDSAMYNGHAGASIYRGSSYSSGGMPAEHDDDDSFNESEEDEPVPEEEGEALYAIKWYKDNEEFYRYVPKANPPKTSYRVDGVRVIEEHSDSSRVLLRGLTLNSTGLYRCEISAEAPNFSSVQGEGRMDIVYLPRDGPHIKGQQFQYQIGEILNLNCTSGKSHPASHLQWFINEQPMLDERYLFKYNDTVHKHGLITSTLGLQMTVDSRHFRDGAMRVKCLASISPVLWKGGKESVLQRRPGIIDNREAMLLVRSLAMNLHSSNNWLRLVTFAIILMSLCQLLFHMELT